MIAWQDPPPHVQYMAEAEQLARMTFATFICMVIGYGTDLEAGQEEVHAFNQRAMIDGISGAEAAEMYLEATAKESKNFERFVLQADWSSAADDPVALKDAAQFLATRCSQASERYPAVVQADGDEATTDLAVLELLARD